MQVASTPTATDAWLERKKILEGNALHIQTRDNILRELAQYQPVLAAIKAEVAAHLNLAEISPDIHALLSTKLMEHRDALNKQIDEKRAISQDLDAQTLLKQKALIGAQGTADNAQSILKGLQDEVAKYQGLLEKTRSEHQSTLIETQNQIAPVVEELSQARNHLHSTQLEEEVLLQSRQAEDIRLANKGRDLAIYESRIREAAAKVNMDIIV